MKTIALGLFALAVAAPAAATPGFIVAAPDRGFLGNAEIRDAFAPFDERERAALVFVTDERGQAYFDQAVAALEDEGAERVVVLPLFLADTDPGLATLRGYAEAHEVGFGRAFGHSVAAPIALADRLRALPAGAEDVVVAGGGDIEHIVAAVRAEFPALELTTAQWSDPEAGMPELTDGTAVVPFHLGRKFDSMMSYNAGLQGSAPDGVTVLDADLTPHPAVTVWMLREAARHRDIPVGKVGVVIHAHGSDFHWNETMRAAAAPLADDHLVEYAFSMGDPPTLARAVRRLEARGAEAVVIVRVFGLERSFTAGIDRFIGADFEAGTAAAAGGHHGHHGHGAAAAPRLLTPLPVVSVGGLEAHSYFADALLERAQALSEARARETVILVAHGVGDDHGNQYWLGLLDALRARMLANGGDAFRAIEVATWREDWPDKRPAAVAHIRGLIEAATADGGRALVIPARTTGTGNARELIADLDYALGSGFAPHPLFVEWLREQVQTGIEEIRAGM